MSPSKPPDETVLGRWSRLKSAARREPSAAVAGTGVDRAAEASDPRAVPAQIPAHRLEADRAPAASPPPSAELAPIEALDADSDYTPFLAEGVPAALKRAALRKLWRSDPVLANLDGLNDYDEDFNQLDELVNLARAETGSAPDGAAATSVDRPSPATAQPGTESSAGGGGGSPSAEGADEEKRGTARVNGPGAAQPDDVDGSVPGQEDRGGPAPGGRRS